MTQIQQIEQLAMMQVDFCGFIFYKKSPRYVLNHLTLNKVKSIQNIQKVGVFVNDSAEEILEIGKKANLDFIQLHGDESVETGKQISEQIPVIQVFSVNSESTDIQHKINEWKEVATYFLFDTKTPKYGGSGKKFDWQILSELHIPKPYFLSGGIDAKTELDFQSWKNPPFALDINSKFEVEPGVKDVEIVKEFQKQIKE